jgi:hypothetical protein
VPINESTDKPSFEQIYLMQNKLLKLNKNNSALFLGLLVGPTIFFFTDELALFEGKQVYDAGILLAVAGMGILSLVEGVKFRKRAGLAALVSTVLIGAIFLKLIVYGAAFGLDDIQWFAFCMEVKPLIYLLFAGLWLRNKSAPTLEDWATYAMWFSVLIIANFFFRAALHGLPVRPKLADEANYDNFIVLLGLIAYYKVNKAKLGLGWILMLAATVASQSKTGAICFVAISAVFFARRGGGTKLFVFFLMIGVGVVVLQYRIDNSNIDKVSQIDRVRMIDSFSYQYPSLPAAEKVFGTVPGIPIAKDDPYIEWFIVNQTEKDWGGYGLQPFNYHGMWMRLILTRGAPSVLLCTGWFFLKFHASRSELAYFVLVVLQGMPMGVFYLSTVSIFAILFGFSLKEARNRHERAKTMNSGLIAGVNA